MLLWRRSAFTERRASLASSCAQNPKTMATATWYAAKRSCYRFPRRRSRDPWVERTIIRLEPDSLKEYYLQLLFIGPSWILGPLPPPHDGNHSTCGYLGVIWTPRRNFNSQVDLIPLCWCRILRSKKVTHFPALWKCQDMAWANPGIERRLQSWLWRSLSYRRKAQLPSFTAIHHSHHASPCRTWFRSRTKNYHNSVIFTTRMKTTTFLFSLLLFGS